MVRKACFSLIPFQAGLLLCFYAGAYLWAAVLFLVSLASAAFAFFGSIRKYIVLCTVSFVAGCVYSSAYTHFVYDDITAFDGVPCTVRGYVFDKTPYQSGERITVSGEINGISGSRINVSVGGDDFQSLDYGDEVEVLCTPVRFTDSREEYNKANGIFLNGKKAQSISVISGDKHMIFRRVRGLRDYVQDRLVTQGGDGGKFLAAMLTGERSGVSDADEEALYRAGIGHIFAFSGTHIAIILSAAAGVIQVLVSKRRISAVIMIMLAWLLAVFSGLSVSAARAAFMVSVLLLSSLAKRPGDALTSLAIAGFVITVISPYCVGAYSYQLSFTGSLGCTAFASYIGERMSRDKQYPPMGREYSVISVICVSLLIMPLCALLFEEISIISPLTNLLIIPVCSFIMVLAVVGLCLSPVIPVLSEYFIWLSGLMMKGVTALTQKLSQLPFASLDMHTDEVRAAVVMLCCVPVIVMLLVCKKRTLVLCYAVSAAVLIVVSAFGRYLSRGKIFITAFVNGSGKDCVLINTNDESVYIQPSGKINAYLTDCLALKKGIQQIDAVITSDDIPDSVSLNSALKYTENVSICSGKAAADKEKITFLTSDGEGVVICGKKVYNRDDVYFTDLSPVEIELDTGDGTVTVRRLDDGFDLSE